MRHFNFFYTTGPDKTESGLGRLEIENREGGAWKQNAISCLELVGFNFSPLLCAAICPKKTLELFDLCWWAVV